MKQKLYKFSKYIVIIFAFGGLIYAFHNMYYRHFKVSEWFTFLAALISPIIGVWGTFLAVNKQIDSERNTLAKEKEEKEKSEFKKSAKIIYFQLDTFYKAFKRCDDDNKEFAQIGFPIEIPRRLQIEENWINDLVNLTGYLDNEEINILYEAFEEVRYTYWQLDNWNKKYPKDSNSEYTEGADESDVKNAQISALVQRFENNYIEVLNKIENLLKEER